MTPFPRVEVLLEITTPEAIGFLASVLAGITTRKQMKLEKVWEIVQSGDRERQIQALTELEEIAWFEVPTSVALDTSLADPLLVARDILEEVPCRLTISRALLFLSAALKNLEPELDKPRRELAREISDALLNGAGFNQQIDFLRATLPGLLVSGVQLLNSNPAKKPCLNMAPSPITNNGAAGDYHASSAASFFLAQAINQNARLVRFLKSGGPLWAVGE